MPAPYVPAESSDPFTILIAIGAIITLAVVSYLFGKYAGNRGEIEGLKTELAECEEDCREKSEVIERFLESEKVDNGKIRELTAEVERLRRIERAARDFMDHKYPTGSLLSETVSSPQMPSLATALLNALGPTNAKGW